jgi:hypothetical protein
MNIGDFSKKNLRGSTLKGTSSQKNILLDTHKLKESHKKDILKT